MAARWWRRVVVVFACIGVAAVVIVGTPAVILLMPAKAGWYDPPPGDTLIVLSAGSVGVGPDLESSWRCIYAARYYRAGLYHTVLISGGSSRSGEPPISREMALFVESLGVPRDHIVLEEQSTNTHENALYTARLLRSMNLGRLVLLTSDYHSRRATDAFRRAGLAVRPLPIPFAEKLVGSPEMRPMVLKLVVHEHVARLVYLLRGWN